MSLRLLTLLGFVLFITPSAYAQVQVTLRIDGLPDSHPENESVYVAGNFNGWQPGLQEFQLQPQADGSLALTFTTPAPVLAFKFTRGSWDQEEVDAKGQVMSNREQKVAAGETFTYQVGGWKDLDGQAVEVVSTASERVHLWQAEMPIQALNRTRRVWVYLPKGYEESEQRYPVLYMHDAQNLFDVKTSFSGEWGVDELLDSLAVPLIVVGIENGGDKRIDEYTPYVNVQRGDGGEGTAYVQFVAETLKPRIDAEFRTQPEGAHTGIMGSSLGSLISLHAATQYPETFSRLGLFSSALWINRAEMKEEVTNYNPTLSVRTYILIGGQEGPMMVADSQWLMADLETKETVVTKYVEQPWGKHHESFWREELPEALRFLYPECFPLAESR